MNQMSPHTKAELLHRLPHPDQRRAIRRAAKLTLRDFATDFGVTVQAVAAWEGGGTPSPLYLARYVSLLESLSTYQTIGDAS
ncbi:helix-turn-helix domain-containing protein [Gemmatimonas sp.]|uniref:helix-turn-helix domain-containing protein n=1 Tax=Gemmatimonas sp. TaxID=1962908 RepID=UPI003569A583